ncbi:MAG: M6 family metalloprotease domain-containing protein, partial [Paludibacteraceae bacterium]|nr:M6 family metalloprotease domain-containing protein [Paludibacteraceae bacterium]
MKKHGFITKFTVLAATIAWSVSANAAPAYPGDIEFRQPDGSTIKGNLHGDEFFDYATSENGYVIVKNGQGYYEYANPDSADLVPSGVRADEPQLRSTAFPKGLTAAQQARAKAISKANRAKQQAAMEGLHPAPTHIVEHDGLRAAKHNGQLHFIIILVGFTDKPFVTSQQEFYNLHNQANLNNIGSTRDFYMQSSWNQFQPTFDVWGPVTVDMTSAQAKDNTGEMIKRACRLVDGLGANFADYDHDNDGTVDNVYCIFAGYDRAQGGGDDCIWSHASGVGGLTLDGKNIGGYGCSSELKGNSGTNHVNIGTFTHEFGHVIGLPDHYDTDGQNNGGGHSPGGWSTMAGGCYNNDSKSPPRFTAHDREQLGWCTIPTIQAGTNTVYNIQDSKDTPALRIPTNNDFEYFVLEFRKKEGFDASFPATGMLIWHVDHSAKTTQFQSGDNWSTRTYGSLWNNNSVNNIEGHPCFDLVEGNGPNVNSGDVSMNANRMWPNGGSNQYSVQAWDNSIVSQLTNITNVNNNYATVGCNNNGGSGVISCITANNPVATFYEDSEYGGKAIGLSKGNYTMAQMARYCLPDHWISSLKVNDGYAVIAYDQDNFEGNSVAYTGNINFVGGTWNDKITSFKIVDNTIDGCGLVTFYADCNRGGTAVSLPLGTYTTTELQLYGIGNDNLSSLEAPEGIEVTLFNNNNCQGDSLVCTGYTACLAGDLAFNDKTSSIRIAAKGKSGLNGLYQIRGRNSGLYWEIYQSGLGNATAIVQTQKRHCDAQFFRLEEI